jgi:DNA polymerase/3'-5' exonuclease PolX
MEMEKRELRRILRVSEKAARKYERIGEKFKYDAYYRSAEQLRTCCRALEEIEGIAREGLDMRA